MQATAYPDSRLDEAIRRHLWKGQLLDDLRRRLYALEWGGNGNGSARRRIALLEAEIARREVDHVACLRSITFDPPAAADHLEVRAEQSREHRLLAPAPAGAGLGVPVPALVRVPGRAP
jgi:hypothetical protein